MRQMMFYAMTEAEMFDPAITVRSLSDIQSKGFDSIYLEFRNTRAPRQSPRFRETVARLCREASRLGLAVVMDSSLNGQNTAMLTDHPEVFTDEPLYSRTGSSMATIYSIGVLAWTLWMALKTKPPCGELR